MKQYDYVLVGGGLYSGVWAYKAAQAGKMCIRDSFSTALLWVVMDKHPEASLEPVNGVYFPSSIVGKMCIRDRTREES